MKKIMLIVGASGVGKDTLLKKAQEQTNFDLEAKTKEKNIPWNFVQRYITRKPDKSENNFFVDRLAFEFLQKNNFFISWWQAHNNLYGIAAEHISEGKNIISVSRTAVQDFEAVYEDVTTIEITFPRELLYKRLRQRNRESETEIQERLKRLDINIKAKNLIRFVNDKPLDVSAKEFFALLKSI